MGRKPEPASETSKRPPTSGIPKRARRTNPAPQPNREENMAEQENLEVARDFIAAFDDMADLLRQVRTAPRK